MSWDGLKIGVLIDKSGQATDHHFDSLQSTARTGFVDIDAHNKFVTNLFTASPFGAQFSSCGTDDIAVPTFDPFEKMTG